MTEIINLNEYRCNDCKFLNNGSCRLFGLDKPKICEHFTLKEDYILKDSEVDYV